MEQPSLFPEQPMQPTEAVDTGVIAEKIAANAKPVEYEDRTSEAAKDQGWGPIEPAEPETRQRPLTNAEQRANAAKHVAKHLKVVRKQVIDPNYG